MAIFTDTNELEQYLRGLNPNYDQYAKDLWTNGVTSTLQLGNASAATLIACGVKSPLHAEDIIAQSKATARLAEALLEEGLPSKKAKTEAEHSDNSDLHESHRHKVETILTRWLLQLEEQKAVLQEENYIADGSPLLQARSQHLEAVTKEIDQVQSYIQLILHKRVWLDMYHDVVRLAMVDLDRKIDLALMHNSGDKKMW